MLVNMRDVTFRERDVVFTFLASIAIGAIAAAAVGALTSIASPLQWSFALVAAILGLVLGPLAAVGGYLGYRSARAGRLRSRWLFAAVVAFGSGLMMDLVIVFFTAIAMGSFVSETINGHPSNPWLDSLPAYPIVFVAGFVPAYLWFAVYAGYRTRPSTRLPVPSAGQTAR